MTTEIKIKKTPKAKPKTIASRKVKDYGNDPFFVKKAKESKAFLEKHGFPKELLLKK
jgi:hypothetical protein